MMKKNQCIFFLLLITLLSSCATSVKSDLHAKFISSKQVIAKDSLFDTRVFVEGLSAEDTTFILSRYEKCNDGNLDATRELSDYLFKNKKNIHSEIYFFIGNCFFLNSKLLEANHYYSMSLNLIKDNEKDMLKKILNNNIAVMYYLNGYFSMGDVSLAKATPFMSHYNLGVKNLLLGNYQQSKKIFSEIYKENKESDLARRLILTSNFLLGEFDDRSLKIGDGASDDIYKRFSKFYFNHHNHKAYDYEDKDLNPYEKVIFKNVNNGIKLGKNED